MAQRWSIVPGLRPFGLNLISGLWSWRVRSLSEFVIVTKTNLDDIVSVHRQARATTRAHLQEPGGSMLGDSEATRATVPHGPNGFGLDKLRGILNVSGKNPGERITHPRQRQLYLIIEGHPARNIQELADELRVRRTAAKHHVRRLIKAGFVVTVRRGRHLLHFPASMPLRQRAALTLLRVPSFRSAVERIFLHPAISTQGLAQELHVSARTVRRVLHKLLKEQLVSIEPDLNGTHRLVRLAPDLRLVLVRWVATETQQPSPPLVPNQVWIPMVALGKLAGASY